MYTNKSNFLVTSKLIYTVISIDTYQNEIIFKDSRLKCHENINVQKNNIYFRYKHIYKNVKEHVKTAA